MKIDENEKLINIEIYWQDLTEKAQKDICEALHMDADDDENWTVYPFATCLFQKHEDEYPESPCERCQEFDCYGCQFKKGGQ